MTDKTITYTTYDAVTSMGQWSGVYATERLARNWARTRNYTTVRRIDGHEDGSETITAI